MVLSTPTRKTRETSATVDPILAITPNGTIAKANLQARRALGLTDAAEQESLGVVLARYIATHQSSQGRLVLSVPNEDEMRQVVLVLSEEETAAPPQPATPESPCEEEAVPNVADFIAHEVRNNIAIMLGFSHLLETNFDALAPTERTAVVHSIESEGEHALGVLEGLLKLAESRRNPEAAIGCVPLHSVVRKVVSNHRRRHPNRDLTVTGDAPVFACGNSSWIQIAVANLLSNAEKVSPEGRTIEVNVRQEAERAIVVVLDAGKALAPEVYPHLWDIYTKGVPKGVEISGSGIGLSLSKELVAAMGGKVWAGPRGDRGSGFAISLQGIADPPA